MKTLKTCLVILCLLCVRTVGLPQCCGAISFMKEIKLSNGKVALVDDEDFEWLNQWKWSASIQGRHFYAVRAIQKEYVRTKIYMHRFIMDALPGDFIDHIDRDPLNNQRNNLRTCTWAENQRNKSRKNNSKSKYIGVHPVPSGKWIAQMTHNGKHQFIGTYKSEEDAAVAYNEMKIKLHGEFCNLNTIEKT